MNKIQTLILTLVFLLMATGSGAANYKITNLSKTGDGTVTLENSSGEITVGTTEIAENSTVKIVVAPNSGFYLDKIVLKYVVDLGQAETRAEGPSIISKVEKPHNTNYAAHFGGTYEFSMPTNNVEIEVTFTACTDIATVVTSMALYGDATYNGVARRLVVNADALKEGEDFSVVWNYPAGFSNVKNVGTYTATITGLGVYNNTKNSEDLIITPKTLNVTANNMSKYYRDADPTFTYSSSGLISGDGFTGALTRNTGDDVGTYAITQGTLSAGANYTINYTGANLTILAKNVSSSASVVLDHESFDYDGSEHKALVSSITDTNGSVAIGPDDYSVTYGTAGEYNATADYTKCDIYTMTINFTRNYAGSKTVYYQIKKRMNPLVGWSTYCEKEASVEVPSGIEAYTVSSCSNSAVIIESRSYIKKGVPMILHRTSGTDNLYATLVREADTNLNGISSMGDYKCADSDIDVSTIANPIWILIDGYFVRSKSGTLREGKCYLAPSASLTRSASLVMSEGTTAIKDPLREVFEDSHWYTLDGRRLQGPPTRKGIYIVNGKKVVIK